MTTIPVQRRITSTDRRRPDKPQLRIQSDINADVYISDILIQLDARFSAYGAIEIKNDGVPLFRQDDLGAFAQYKNFRISALNTILRETRALEIWIWNPHTEDPVSVSVNLTYSDERLEPGPLGSPRSLSEFNQELSVAAGGLEPATRALLDELGKLRANIGARRITIDVPAVEAKIAAAIRAIETGETPESIQARLTELYELLGDQEIANDLTGITAQLQGILEAINNNEIEIETARLEDLLDDIKDKTIPDDLGISDGIEIARGAPVPAAAKAPLNAILEALIDLRNGFDLNELKRAIATFETQIPLFEAGAPDETLTDQMRLILMRLKRLNETIPDPRSSESGLLFPEARYMKDTTHVNVLDTKGHTHFIATMKSTPITDPSRILDDTEARWGGSTAYTRTIYYDAKESQFEKRVRICLAINTGRDLTRGGLTTIQYATGNDLEALKAAGPGSQISSRISTSWISGAFGYQPTTEIQAPKRFERYHKITINMGLHNDDASGPPGQPERDRSDQVIPDPADYKKDLVYVKGVEDDGLVRGRATLSFEFMDGLGNWYPAIAGSPASTIQTGGAPVIIRFSEATYGFPLPAGGSVFRARLDITNGNIDLGVALLLLS